MATRKGNGRKNGKNGDKNGSRDLLAHRMLRLERYVGATNARLDVTNIRLEHLGHVMEEAVAAIRGMRDDFRTLAAEVRELRLDHARVDRLEARVERLERDA